MSSVKEETEAREGPEQRGGVLGERTRARCHQATSFLAAAPQVCSAGSAGEVEQEQ